MSTTVPKTFRSEHALADAVDAAFAEALAEELAATAEEDTASPLALPETDVLIAQAGIAAGPCPPDPRGPSPAGRATRAGTRLAGRAAWWLIKGAMCVTALLLVQTVRALWHLTGAGPPAASVSSSQFLAATSDEIHHRGWTQHRYRDSRGVCVLGAQQALIERGVGDRATAGRSSAYLLAAAGHQRSVPAWNDALSRREEHIHAALYRAAARARAVGD